MNEMRAFWGDCVNFTRYCFDRIVGTVGYFFAYDFGYLGIWVSIPSKISVKMFWVFKVLRFWVITYLGSAVDARYMVLLCADQ